MKNNKTCEYVVKGDGEFFEAFSTLSAAREYIRNMYVIVGGSKMPRTIQLVKVISVSVLMNEYEVEPAVTLRSVDAFDGMDLA